MGGETSPYWGWRPCPTYRFSDKALCVCDVSYPAKHEIMYRSLRNRDGSIATDNTVHVRQVLTSGSSSVSSSSTTSALYSSNKSLIGFESRVQLMKGCLRSSSQVGLFWGSLIRHVDTKSLNSFDHFDGCSSLGGSDFWIFNSTLIGDISWLGGSIWANSIRVIPIDQTSTLKSYGLSRKVSQRTTSGAIQYGVPMNVSCFCIVLLFLADTPKSAGENQQLLITLRGVSTNNNKWLTKAICNFTTRQEKMSFQKAPQTSC